MMERRAFHEAFPADLRCGHDELGWEATETAVDVTAVFRTVDRAAGRAQPWKGRVPSGRGVARG
jgi:hypothetical protein